MNSNEIPTESIVSLAAEDLESDYSKLVWQVDEVYAAIGARVIRGISYAGEDPVRLYLPNGEASYSNYPA